MAPRKPHFLILPFPAQGHFNALLQFASSLLLTQDCSITLVHTQRLHSTTLGAHNTIPPHLQGIQFFTIPDGLPPDLPLQLDMSHDTFEKLLIGIKQQQGLLHTLLESSCHTDSPFSCVVLDFFFVWMLDLAENFGIPAVPFWSSSAIVYHIGSLVVEGKLHVEAPELDEVARLLRVDRQELLAAFPRPDLKLGQELFKMFERLGNFPHLLVNSFQDLEAPYILGAPSNIRYVGPCLPAATDLNTRVSFYEEDMECLGWLDMQEKASVVYICLGSVALFAPSQLEEIAMGIEASNHKFLWVIRPDAQANSKLPEGFEERTKGRGMLVSWAPQLKVLEHTAIGAFFTHCGWNSTLESIFMGVPMLCFPIFAEQPANGLFIEKLWQVGIRFNKREDGIVERGEVVRAVKEIMDGLEGRKLRDQALKLKIAARKASEVGGPSCATLASFFKDIIALQSPSHLEP